MNRQQERMSIMLFRQACWGLSGSKKKIWLRLTANDTTIRVFSIFDTGAEYCVFPSHITDVLFPDSRDGKVSKIQGVGGEIDVVAHYVKVDFLDDNERDVLLTVPKVRAYFALDKDYDLSLIGVLGCLDQFDWKLNYKTGDLLAS